MERFNQRDQILSRPNIWGLALLALTLFVVACAPPVEKREFAPARQSFATSKTDTDLNLDSLGPNSTVRIEQLPWTNERLESAEIFRSAERLLRLADRLKRPRLVQASNRLTQAFYQGPQTTLQVNFHEGLFPRAAIGETRESTIPFLERIRGVLLQERLVIKQVLETSGAQFDWPQGRMNLDQLVQEAERFIKWWLSRLSAVGVDPILLSPIEDATLEELRSQTAQIRPALARLLETKTLTESVTYLQQALIEFGVTLSPSATQELGRASQIGRSIDQIRTELDALALLVEFWTLLSPEAREAQFKPLSEKLYKFLNERSAEDLECLKRSTCLNPVLALARRIEIFPALKEYGLTKIQAQMNSAARDFLVAEVEAQATSALRDLPILIQKKLDREVETTVDWISSIRTNYDGFIKNICLDWAALNLIDRTSEATNATSQPTLVAFETRQVSVQFAGTGQGLKIRAKTGSFEAGAESMGASMAWAGFELNRRRGEAEANQPFTRKLALTQIGKMLAMGGFRDVDGSLFKSFSVNLNRSATASQRHLNLRDFLSSRDLFAVLDRFSIDKQLQMNPPRVQDQRVSVRAQAELLRGLTQMMLYLRDWQSSGFDLSLGRSNVGDFLKSGPKGAVKEQLFPKDVLFSLSLGNAATILQNLSKESAPVFLINLQQESFWANEFDFSTGNSSTMAALVDVVGGVRQDVARTEDVARFGLAVLDFLTAIDGIRASRAELLQTKDARGQTAIDQIVKASDDLRKLAIGLANFLARQMRDQDGGLRSQYNRRTQRFDSSKRLLDQALAIQMLVRSAQILKVRAYSTAALEAYYFMNQKLWDRTARFYVSDFAERQVPTPDVVLTVLEAGEELVPYMTESSRVQWQKISQPWLQAFESL